MNISDGPTIFTDQILDSNCGIIDERQDTGSFNFCGNYTLGSVVDCGTYVVIIRIQRHIFASTEGATENFVCLEVQHQSWSWVQLSKFLALASIIQ